MTVNGSVLLGSRNTRWSCMCDSYQTSPGPYTIGFSSSTASGARKCLPDWPGALIHEIDQICTLAAPACHGVGSSIGLTAIGNCYSGWEGRGITKPECHELQVALASEHAPCAFLQNHTTAEGSFRFSSVRMGDYRVAVSGIPEGYGIKKMTAGGVDLLLNPIKLVASTTSEVLIEVARVEDMSREMSSVLHVGQGLRSSCLINQVRPVYPSQAKAAHIVGNVIMSIGVDKNGYVEDVTVVQGHPSLIQPAIDAVRQWRYVPVVLRGETVPVVITVVVPFGSK